MSDYVKHREKKLAHQKEYYQANKEERLSYAQEYRKKNSARVRKERYDDYRAQPEMYMLHRARGRSKKEGWFCDLTVEDIRIPEYCPLLGIPLVVGAGRGKNGPSSPSLDRIEPSKGYVKGNVWVISDRANSIKRDALYEEFEMMYIRWTKMKELGYPTLGESND